MLTSIKCACGRRNTGMLSISSLSSSTGPRGSRSSSVSDQFGPLPQSPQSLSAASTSSHSSQPDPPKLDDVISRKFLIIIARNYLNDWKKLAPFLNLSRQQETAIAKTSTDYDIQKQMCLELWQEKEGNKGTYNALISAAEEAKDKQLADNIKSLP